jgi:prepilin-type N-terminal cleavage/methylation domain-containing protein
MRQERQNGFSLLELLVAMMIIAVIATLGFKQYNKYSAQARYLKAQDTLQVLGSGLDQYFLKHGVYPQLATYESMIDANSPLVKENMIPVNVPAKDPWGEPYEATSGKWSPAR